jgi:hypothetical protein
MGEFLNSDKVRTADFGSTGDQREGPDKENVED